MLSKDGRVGSRMEQTRTNSVASFGSMRMQQHRNLQTRKQSNRLLDGKIEYCRNIIKLIFFSLMRIKQM